MKVLVAAAFAIALAGLGSMYLGSGTAKAATVTASYQCQGNDLVVTVTDGDGPFTVSVASTPLTTVTSYIGFPVGDFLFANDANELATRFTSVTVTESGGDTEVLQLATEPIVCGARAVVATYQCQGNDLVVTVTDGDQTFTVNAIANPATTVTTYIGFPAGNFLFANDTNDLSTLFTSVTVTEAGGDLEVLQLANEPILCGARDLAVSYQCQDNDLVVTVKDGDPTFTVSASSNPSTAVVAYIGFGVGDFLFANTADTATTFTSLIVTESGGDKETLQLATEPIICGPDLAVSKTASEAAGVGGFLVDEPFQWSIEVSNQGSASAVLGSGFVLLRDDLPNGAASITGVESPAGLPVACDLAGSQLTCTTSGGQLQPGESFAVSVEITPGSSGRIVNPRPGGVCATDPEGALTEQDEMNNNCRDAVEVLGLPTLEVAVFGEGSGPVAGRQILVSGCGYWETAITNTLGIAAFENLPPDCSVRVEKEGSGLILTAVTSVEGTYGDSLEVVFTESAVSVPPAVSTQPPGTASPTPSATMTASPTPTAPATATPTEETPEPTATPTAPPATATATPTDSSGVDVPVTPKPPATGTGATGNSSTSVLLAVFGLVAVASGFMVLAIGRKRA